MKTCAPYLLFLALVAVTIVLAATPPTATVKAETTVERHFVAAPEVRPAPEELRDIEPVREEPAPTIAESTPEPIDTDVGADADLPATFAERIRDEQDEAALRRLLSSASEEEVRASLTVFSDRIRDEMDDVKIRSLLLKGLSRLGGTVVIADAMFLLDSAGDRRVRWAAARSLARANVTPDGDEILRVFEESRDIVVRRFMAKALLSSGKLEGARLAALTRVLEDPTAEEGVRRLSANTLAMSSLRNNDAALVALQGAWDRASVEARKRVFDLAHVQRALSRASGGAQ